MNPEKQHLLHALLEDGDEHARRAATLSAGGNTLRRRRRRRVALRGLALAAVATLAAVGVHHTITPRPTTATERPPGLAANYAGSQVRFLSDDELFDLFPGTPVGLAKFGAKKILIFPRPGDEARFVSRRPDLPGHP